MSNTWIGMIKLTNEDGVYGSDGEKILNYNYCDGSELDGTKFPILASKLPAGVGGSYTGETYSIGGDDGCALTPTRMYGADGNTTYEYDLDGNLLGTISTPSVKGLGSYEETLLVHRWNPSLVTAYVDGVAGFSFSTDAEVGTGPRGVCFDGEYYWVIGANTDEIYQYSSDGIYTGFSFEHGVWQDQGAGLNFDGNYLILSGRSPVETIYFDRDGNYQGIYIETTQGGYGMGLSGGSLITCSQTEMYKGVLNETTLPLMDAPTNSPAPYKIISDLYWYQIGDILKSNDNKLVGESGTEEFDLLLCDGSGFDELIYVGLYTKLGSNILPNMASPDPTCPYRVVADKYTPVIGDIRSSKFEKYSENGVELFDQLLCDGSEVDSGKYPLLASSGALEAKIDLTLIQPRIFTTLCGNNQAEPSFDYTNTDLKNYTTTYGATYAAGKGYFQQYRGDKVGPHTITYDTDLDINEWVFPLRLYGSGINTSVKTEFVWLDSSGNSLFTITIHPYNFGCSMGLTGPDGIISSSRLTSGYVDIKDGVAILLDTSHTSQCSVDNVDLSNAVKLHVSGGLYSAGCSMPTQRAYIAIDRIENITNILPDHTPLDENYPKRIVADLTGGT